MNFTAVELPATVDLNAFKAYFDLAAVRLPRSFDRTLQGAGSSEAIGEPVKSLRHLVLDAIATQWHEYPILQALPRREDRNYLLSQLDVATLPVRLLSVRIRDDFFWHKCCQQRWKTPAGRQRGATPKSWLTVYMERHLQEYVERLPPADYDAEAVQAELDICAPHINQLEINCLQPSSPTSFASPAAAAAADSATQTQNDHIPLDYILHNLPELRALRLAFCTKTAGMNFIHGCNAMTQNDIYRLARGLSRCYELQTFCLHSTKLEPYQLKFIARSLDKGCQQLTHLSLAHCALGDDGIRHFVESCYRESFATLCTLDLTNNRITAEGAYILSRVLRRVPLQRFVLRLNPIESDGAATIFCLLDQLPTEQLDLSGCSLCPVIMKLFMKLLIQHRTLRTVDISNNGFGEDFGRHLYKIIGFNKTLQRLDLRNTGMSFALRNRFKQLLRHNLPKSEDSAFRLYECKGVRPGACGGKAAEDVQLPQ